MLYHLIIQFNLLKIKFNLIFHFILFILKIMLLKQD